MLEVGGCHSATQSVSYMITEQFAAKRFIPKYAVREMTKKNKFTVPYSCVKQHQTEATTQQMENTLNMQVSYPRLLMPA